MDIRFFIPNPSAFDNINFLFFSPGASHVNKHRFFMKEAIQGVSIFV